MKGENAESAAGLECSSWAKSKQLYDCHLKERKKMGRYQVIVFLRSRIISIKSGNGDEQTDYDQSDIRDCQPAHQSRLFLTVQIYPALWPQN